MADDSDELSQEQTQPLQAVEHVDTPIDKEVEKEAAKLASGVGSGKTMHVKVYAPFKVYFDGEAQSISAINDTGPFDILPKHHNFMTLINPCDIIVRTAKGEERVSVSHGIMHIKADQVIVFLDV